MCFSLYCLLVLGCRQKILAIAFNTKVRVLIIPGKFNRPFGYFTRHFGIYGVVEKKGVSIGPIS